MLETLYDPIIPVDDLSPTLPAPLTFSGRYEVLHELGRGGMGMVYLARDNYLEREVAVKVLNRHTLGTEGRTLLLNEARAAARLSHPNVTMIFDVGEQDRIPFIVMEYVPGKTLAEAMPRRMDEVIRLARQLCAALHHAHQKGLVHRDVKPHNVMITAEGVAKLMDFGLAQLLDKPMESGDSFAGTIAYIAPEQATGEPINHLADLYGLGVTLYEMATGTVPFTGNSAQILIKHIQELPLPPRARNKAVPPALNELILHLLQKKPENRPQSADEVGQLLEILNHLYRMEPLERRV